MPENPIQAGGIDDDEVAESIRFIHRDRSKKRMLSVLGVVIAAVVLGTAVYLAYSDEPEAAKEIEAAQPGGP